MNVGTSERERGGGQSFPPINHRTALLEHLLGIHLSGERESTGGSDATLRGKATHKEITRLFSERED